jgi:hypothetical protein
MSRLLCTMPGRYGDVLWSLATARAIAEANGGQVDLQIAGEFSSLVPLLKTAAPYLGEVWAEPSWVMVPPEEWRAPICQGRGDGRTVIHLGYRSWPEMPLAQWIYTGVKASYGSLAMGPLELDRPWLEAERYPTAKPVWVAGWTECWFELKVGLQHLLFDRFRMPLSPMQYPINLSASGRWQQEQGNGTPPWDVTARWIKSAPVFLTDCSAMHVLAVALGTPVLLVEPMEARWNPIFYPVGMDGPQVTVVKGLDGKPTYDARHVGDALQPYVEAACAS